MSATVHIGNTERDRTIRVMIQAPGGGRFGDTFSRIVKWFTLKPGETADPTIHPGQSLVIEPA